MVAIGDLAASNVEAPVWSLLKAFDSKQTLEGFVAGRGPFQTNINNLVDTEHCEQSAEIMHVWHLPM